MGQLTFIDIEILQSICATLLYSTSEISPQGQLHGTRSTIIPFCTLVLLEPTTLEGCKGETFAVTVTVWPGRKDLMVLRFIVVGLLTLRKPIVGKGSTDKSPPIRKSSAFELVSMQNFLIFTGESVLLNSENLLNFGGEKHTPQTILSLPRSSKSK